MAFRIPSYSKPVPRRSRNILPRRNKDLGIMWCGNLAARLLCVSTFRLGPRLGAGDLSETGPGTLREPRIADQDHAWVRSSGLDESAEKPMTPRETTDQDVRVIGSAEQHASSMVTATTLSDSQAPQPVRACIGRWISSWQNR
jgi:hypothetical protein